MAKAEADKMMQEVKNTFIAEYGLASWDQILKETTRIKKAQKAIKLQEQKEHEELMNNVMLYGTVALLFLFLAACGVMTIIAMTH